MILDELLAIPPYSLKREDKRAKFFDIMLGIHNFHRANSPIFRNILEAQGEKDLQVVEDFPFIPVSLFKDFDLLSVPREEITKTMTSSGTTGQKVSRVLLDAVTTRNQSKVLTKIITSFIGPKRLPLLILDSPIALRDPRLFSARGAGLLGFAMFGRDTEYALDSDMKLNLEAVQNFLTRHVNSPILLFGYTFMIWKHFFLALQEKGVTLDFGKDSILFHVGGWKKLKDLAVDAPSFRRALETQCGISRVYDYYGMAEQLGSIYVACEKGHLHASIFSDVIIRNPDDFSVCKNGESGIIQVISVLPHSYPGHSLLTEDEGVILGEDDCPCGRLGKYFKINGRLKNAEIRGCSDTYAARF